MLAITFAAVMLFCVGGYVKGKNIEDLEVTTKAPLWAWAILLLNPFIKSSAQIMMRTVRNMHDSLITSWLNVA